MELTVADDFQQNLDQVTIVSILSHLAGTMNGIEYLHSPHENMKTLEKVPIQWESPKLNKLNKCLTESHNYANQRIRQKGL